MFVTKLAFVAIAVLAVQGTSANNNAELMSVKMQGEEAINQLEIVVFQSVKDAEARVSKAIDRLQAKSDIMVANIEARMRPLLEELLKEIQDIQDKAIKIGIDAVECYYENLDQLKAITQQFIDEAVECIKHQVDRAIDFAKDVYKDLEDVIELYKNIVQRWNDCDGNVGCYTLIITDVALSIVKIPLVVYNRSYKAATLIVNMGKNLMLCESKVVLGFIANASDEIKNLATCIADRIEINDNLFQMYKLN